MALRAAISRAQSTLGYFSQVKRFTELIFRLFSVAQRVIFPSYTVASSENSSNPQPPKDFIDLSWTSSSGPEEEENEAEEREMDRNSERGSIVEREEEEAVEYEDGKSYSLRWTVLVYAFWAFI